MCCTKMLFVLFAVLAIESENLMMAVKFRFFFLFWKKRNTYVSLAMFSKTKQNNLFFEE